MAIDHFSRKVVCTMPLEGPNAGWIIDALEQTIQEHGTPKHIISDQAKVFVGDAFAELLKQWNIKPRALVKRSSDRPAFCESPMNAL